MLTLPLAAAAVAPIPIPMRSNDPTRPAHSSPHLHDALLASLGRLRFFVHCCACDCVCMCVRYFACCLRRLQPAQRTVHACSRHTPTCQSWSALECFQPAVACMFVLVLMACALCSARSRPSAAGGSVDPTMDLTDAERMGGCLSGWVRTCLANVQQLSGSQRPPCSRRSCAAPAKRFRDFIACIQ